MNKKKLPKAVLRTADQMRDGDGVAAPKPIASNNVVEMIPKPEFPRGAPDAGGPSELGTLANPQRRKAIALVERYANYSAVGGAIPIPFANAVAITTLLVRMIKALSELYGVPFERSRTRSIVIGLMGGALPTGFATIATTSLTYFVPGLNLMGLAVSSVTSGAYARAIGQLYIEHFENGAAVDFRTIIKR